jgi:hypothetical protein
MARLHRGHLVGVLACVSLVTAMLGGAAASAATLPTTEECAAPGANPPPPSFSQWPQVVLIAFENKDPNYVLPGGAHDGQGVLGNPKAKYFTQLAADCGRVVNYHAIGYPSLPNYIAQTAGMIPPYIASKGGGLGRDCRWTPGQTSNKCHVTYADSPGLFHQLGATGWLSTQASMTVNCEHGDDANGLYVQRHNPATYFDDLNGVSAGGAPTSLACPGGNLGMTSYTAEDVPFPDPFVTHSTFTWVTPDLCDDGHSKLASCFSTNLVANADHFLQGFLPQLLATPEYQQGRMAIFLWWDSDVHAPKNGAGGGPNIVPLIVLSKNTPAGSVVTGGVPGNCAPASDCTGAVPNHYSLLRTIEDMTEPSPVPYLGHAGDIGQVDLRKAFNLCNTGVIDGC